MASDRPARSTRGKRMTALLGEEAEADESFWGQQAFAESNDDKSFDENEEEMMEQDEFDSDFNDSEDETHGNGGVDEEEKAVRREERRDNQKSKKTKRYVDPVKKKQASSTVAAINTTTVTLPDAGGAASTNTTSAKTTVTATLTPATPVDRSKRKSTKIATETSQKVQRQSMIDQVHRQYMRQRRLERDKDAADKRVWTQDERLHEALNVTEKSNKEDLERLLRLERELKRVPVRNKKQEPPECLYVSRDGKQYYILRENLEKTPVHTTPVENLNDKPGETGEEKTVQENTEPPASDKKDDDRRVSHKIHIDASIHAQSSPQPHPHSQPRHNHHHLQHYHYKHHHRHHKCHPTTASVAFFTQKRAPPYPLPYKCVVTGLKARYRDPQTSMPYLGIEEFKAMKEAGFKARIEVENMKMKIEVVEGEGAGEGKKEIEGKETKETDDMPCPNKGGGGDDNEGKEGSMEINQQKMQKMLQS